MPGSPELGNQVLTVVCIFLPLSAIWAGVDKESSIAGRGTDSHQRLFSSEFYNSTTRSIGASSTSTAYDKSRQLSVYTIPKSKDKEDIESMAMSPSSHKRIDVEDGSIRVDHEYGFSREDATHRL